MQINRFLKSALKLGVISFITLQGYSYAASPVIHFRIDRSKVPALYYNDITLKVKACGATTATVMAGTTTIPNTVANDFVLFNTSADSVTVTLNNTTTDAGVGSFSKACLKNDKQWAWSHSLDDNSSLDDEVAAFKSRGYKTLKFLIGGNTDASQITTDCNYGNHSNGHGYATDTAAARLDAEACQAKLLGLILPKIPGYKMIAFASPMFDAAWGGIIRRMRKAKDTDLLYAESSNYYRIRLDSGGVNFGGFVRFDTTYDIGRYDFPAPWNAPSDYAGWQRVIDTMHTLTTGANGASRHFWYNTFNHGGEDNNNLIPRAVAYVDTHYADHSTSKEAWIAPSDEIYSYIMVRTKTVITNDMQTPVLFAVPPIKQGAARVISALSISGSRVVDIQLKMAGTVEIFDMLGNRIASFNQTTNEQPNITWKAHNAGRYFIRFQGGNVKDIASVFIK